MSEEINVAEVYDKGRALFMGIELLVAPGALVPPYLRPTMGKRRVHV